MKKIAIPIIFLFSLFLSSQEQDTILARLQKEVKQAIVNTNQTVKMIKQ